MQCFLPCKTLNDILERVDRALDPTFKKNSVHLHFSNSVVIIDIDGYTDYGRRLNIWRKVYILPGGWIPVPVLRAERDNNDWVITYVKTGPWIQSITDLIEETPNAES